MVKVLESWFREVFVFGDMKVRVGSEVQLFLTLYLQIGGFIFLGIGGSVFLVWEIGMEEKQCLILVTGESVFLLFGFLILFIYLRRFVEVFRNF